MTRLCELSCRACRGDMPRLAGAELDRLAAEVPDWRIVEGHHLARTFRLADFRAALELVNRIGELAEAEGHHPDIRLSWGRVDVEIHTHKVSGLTESDFILAAKIDRL